MSFEKFFENVHAMRKISPGHGFPHTGLTDVVTLALPGNRQAQMRPSESLPLQIEAPQEFAAIRTRLESADPQRFAGIARFLGLADDGPIIKVVLAPEASHWA